MPTKKAISDNNLFKDYTMQELLDELDAIETLRTLRTTRKLVARGCDDQEANESIYLLGVVVPS